MPRVKRITRPIPSISVRTNTIELNDYSDGMDSFISNDKFPVKDGGTNMWRLAQNARVVTLGEYRTRQAIDYYSDAAGETLDDSQVSIAGAGTVAFSQTAWVADTFTAAETGRLTKLDVKLANTAGGTGTPLIEVYTDSSGAPGTLLARSSLAASELTDTADYLTVRFAEPPLLADGTNYWIVGRVQATGSNNYDWSTTTNTTTALTSSDSGSSWEAASYSLNFRQYYATDGAVKGLFRGTKSDGTKITLYAHDTTLYSVNEVTGALTSIKDDLNSSATDYQFEMVNDIIYYVNGFDGYRKWDFTDESQVNSTNYTHIAKHKGLMFLVRKDDPNRIDFSNFGEYEVFTSTDFLTAPAPKAGDPITALVSLNGGLFIKTLNNTLILSGEDNATFILDEAPDQNGTYTQQTVTKDDNFMYYLTAAGVYRSNGAEPQLLSAGAYEDVKNLNHSGAVMAINKNRLYLWYKSAGSAYNDSCYVWNLSFGSSSKPTLESHDTDSFVSRAINCPNDDGALMVASSLVGQVYWQELESNDYTNLGGDINFELDTHSFTFGTPAVEKSIPLWLPRFGATSSDYRIACEYATDLRNNWQLASNTSTQGSGPVWGDFNWGDGSVWGTTAEVTPRLSIPGEHNRIAVRYKHYAARQPHRFFGHTLRTRMRRLR